MGEVTSVSEVEAHESVAGLEACHQDCHVGLCSRMRLHVSIFCLKNLTEPVDRKLLDLVDYFAAAIVSCSRISLCIFVGADGSERLKYLLAYVVLRSDEFYSRLLSVLFLFNEVENLKVLFHMFRFIKDKSTHFFFFYEIKSDSSYLCV